jgi:hypothetical protein
MWWMLAGGLLAGMFGLEGRRVLRDRANDARGVRIYALYRAGDPYRALRLIEVGGDVHPALADDWLIGVEAAARMAIDAVREDHGQSDAGNAAGRGLYRKHSALPIWNEGRPHARRRVTRRR